MHHFLRQGLKAERTWNYFAKKKKRWVQTGVTSSHTLFDRIQGFYIGTETGEIYKCLDGF